MGRSAEDEGDAVDDEQSGQPRGLKWVAVVAGAAIVAGVGVLAIDASGDDVPSDEEVRAAMAVAARLERVDAMSYGTWEQHSAGAYLDYLANTVEVKACMEGRGERFGYRFIDPYAGRPDELGVGDNWAAPLLSTAPSQRALGSARYDWLAEKYGDANPDWNWNDKSDSYQRAYGRCRHLRTNHPGHPPKYLEVPSELHALVSAAEQELGPPTEYDSCMLDAGYEVYQDDFGGADAMQMMVEDQAPSSDLPPRKLARTDEWAQFLAFEQEVLRADYDCRVEKFVQVMAEIDAPLAEFERTHAEDLSALQAEWGKITAEAEELGWTG